jgi:hypothetical protein
MSRAFDVNRPEARDLEFLDHGVLIEFLLDEIFKNLARVFGLGLAIDEAKRLGLRGRGERADTRQRGDFDDFHALLSLFPRGATLVFAPLVAPQFETLIIDLIQAARLRRPRQGRSAARIVARRRAVASRWRGLY